MRNNLRVIFLSTLFLSVPLQAAKKVIDPPEFAPKPGAAAPMYSPGILVDGTLYVAGQIGQDLKTGEIPSSFEAEVKVCLDRIGIILKAAGIHLRRTVRIGLWSGE